MTTAARSLGREEKQQLINLHELTESFGVLELMAAWQTDLIFLRFPRLSFLHVIITSASPFHRRSPRCRIGRHGAGHPALPDHRLGTGRCIEVGWI